MCVASCGLVSLFTAADLIAWVEGIDPNTPAGSMYIILVLLVVYTHRM